MISSNVLVHLGTTWTNTGEPLKRAFNALDSYQTVGRWSLFKTHIHEPWGVTKRALKPQLRPPTTRNHEVVYIQLDQRQTRYIDSPKSIHWCSNIQNSWSFSKNSCILTLTTETLWQESDWWPPYGSHCSTFTKIVTGPNSIWTNLQDWQFARL